MCLDRGSNSVLATGIIILRYVTDIYWYYVLCIVADDAPDDSHSQATSICGDTFSNAGKEKIRKERNQNVCMLWFIIEWMCL